MTHPRVAFCRSGGCSLLFALAFIRAYKPLLYKNCVHKLYSKNRTLEEYLNRNLSKISDF